MNIDPPLALPPTPASIALMRRRDLLGGATAGLGIAASSGIARAAPADSRALTVALATRIADPVLSRMAAGRLQREFVPELSPVWDGRNPRVSFMEAFARLTDGLAPWLALADNGSAEGRVRARLRQQALTGFVHSVDPASPDYLLWKGEGQALVDAAFYVQALLRARKALWEPLDNLTKRRIVDEVRALRSIAPPYSNWLLFAAMNEAFLLSIGEQWDPMRIGLAIRKVTEWYVGDGWYSDGPRFHFDYYGAFVIHPMLVEILDVLVATGASVNGPPPAELRDQAVRRMQRYGEQLERLIGPDGSFPPIGRSMVYRSAAFQPLALLALQKRLPASLPPGQVRAALDAMHQRVFGPPSSFDAKGFLTLGLAGHQPALADRYSNSGSTYIAANSLLALGLPADDPFWTAPAAPWTQARAWAGEAAPRDYHVDY